MKKLLAVVLILALLLPVAALADDTADPIIGHWYLLFDKNVSPELASNFQDNDYIFMIFSFLSDGTILQSEIDIKDKTGNPYSGSAGKWERSGYDYSYSIIALGSGKALLEGDSLLLQMQNSTIYLKLHKLIPLDAYNDYVFK